MALDTEGLSRAGRQGIWGWLLLCGCGHVFFFMLNY